MMTSFDDAFTALMGNEGHYSDNPADPGGATCWGVSERIARAWGYTGDMRDLPQDTAKLIAKKWYWDPYLCDQYDPRIAFAVFDAAYNGGLPAKWLQSAVGTEPDGIIGARTIAAARGADPLRIVMRFSAYRLKYLGNLKTWQSFGHGWANRIADNLIKGAA
jgi:lysozyme family protein